MGGHGPGARSRNGDDEGRAQAAWSRLMQRSTPPVSLPMEIRKFSAEVRSVAVRGYSKVRVRSRKAWHGN